MNADQVTSYQENTLKNEKHYDEAYKKVNIGYIADKIENVDSFLEDATKTDTSWVGLYYNDFKDKLKGKKVLELGCGNCLNLAVMSALGAEVYGNDISQESGRIIDELNKRFDFEYPIKFVKGDFLYADIDSDSFDIVVGKAFVHHLTNEQEVDFTEKIVRILKTDGTVRYFEPAVNSKTLDELRWITPMPHRPSKLSKKRFKKWKANDPHPDRDNSSKHYRKIGSTYFEETQIVPIGTLERFCKLVPGKYKRPLRRLSYKLERLLPNSLNLLFARSQTVEYSHPKKSTS
jgi:SAM-dependent methyltransferase